MAKARGIRAAKKLMRKSLRARSAAFAERPNSLINNSYLTFYIMNNDSERIVFNIPVDISAEEFAPYCRIKKDSAAFEMLEDVMPLIQKHGAPKAIIKWASVDRINGDETTIDGITFTSKVVADKLKETPRVFLSVVTAGEGLERSGEFDGDPFLDT